MSGVTEPGFSWKAMRDAAVLRFGGGLLGALWMVGAGAAASRVAATVKDMVVANRFGTSDAYDAYLIAFAVPVFLAGSFRSAFFSAFVPRFLDAGVRRGPEGASDLLRKGLTMQIGVLICLAALLAGAAVPVVSLITRGFSPEKAELTARLMRALAPFVVLDGIAGIYASTLYARRRFAAAALVSTLPPLASLAAVVALATPFGVNALVIGALSGAALELLASASLVRREGLSVAPTLSPYDADAAALLRGFGILAWGAMLMSANSVVDQAMATAAGSGSIAVIGYGAKIPAAVLGLAGVALGAATLPHYAEMAAAKQWDEIARSLRRHTIRIGLVSLAGACALAAVSRPLVSLLFQHGKFDAADTSRVAAVQAFYALQLPGYLVGIVGARVLNALGRDRWILAVSALNFILNIGGNWLLLRWIGLPGIALSTATFYTIGAVVLLTLCRRALREKRSTGSDT